MRLRTDLFAKTMRSLAQFGDSGGTGEVACARAWLDQSPIQRLESLD
jgi:hypothetical protein